jgi:hypothetical protein
MMLLTNDPTQRRYNVSSTDSDDDIRDDDRNEVVDSLQLRFATNREEQAHIRILATQSEQRMIQAKKNKLYGIYISIAIVILFVLYNIIVYYILYIY